MPIHKTEALVIKRSDFRETSMIARFYSREFGKMSGILKGIRQEPGKFASTLEPFSHNDLIFYKKRNSTLHLVSHCETRENFDLIRQNLAKANAAHLVIELIDAIMQEEDKNEEVFDLALLTLRELTTNYNADKIMTIFKIKILALSGFKPHFDSCVSCGDRILGQSKFSVSQGGLLCSRCYKKDLSARAIFRGTVASILHIERNDFQNTLTLGMNPQIKKELDLILNSFLSFHLQKEIKTLRVINQMGPAPKKLVEVSL